MSHEQAFLLDTAGGVVLVYAVEVADYEAATRAFQELPFPIGAEHKAVMAEVLEGVVDVPLLLDVRA